MFDLSYSKNHRTIQQIARDILAREVGERLPTSIQYQEELEVGSGTVQKGIRVLQNVGAVRLRPRGHQGTLIVDRNVGALWAIAGLGPVTGALPLPDSLENAGLASGLREQFDAQGIPLQMLYRHGAALRLGMVREGRADFAIASQGAGENQRAADEEGHWTILDFGPYSYYSEGSIVVLSRWRTDGSVAPAIRTVGIDLASHDHTRLTLAEFPESGGYVYESISYPSLPAAVAEGRVDGAIWHRTLLSIPLSLVGVDVTSPRQETLEVYESMASAILLAPAGKPELAALLRHLDIERIRDLQTRVLRGETPPEY